MTGPQRRRLAFTLVELLVVIGVIAVLVAILLPTLTKAREQARRVACGSQLRQFGIAIYCYAHDNHGWLPIATGAPAGCDNDVLEYPFTIGANTYVNNLTDLYPRYIGNKKLFLCPSFQAREDPNYYFWYGWIDKAGPLNPNDYKRMSYLYLSWRNVVYFLASFGPNSAIYGQGSIRFGQKWPFRRDDAFTTEKTVWMADNVADSRMFGLYEGCIWPQLFASQHFYRHNLGANALHGDGSVEWVPISSGRFVHVGNGYWNVSDQ
jgi:prepilin-type N-terminal cleavage/methylation domain-containing protein/prepilin-type processing-associated H-X9-DG protein